MKKVSETYLGNGLPNLQALGTRGATSGGSQPTPQTQRMTTDSGSKGSKLTIPTSRPKSAQKIRG